MTKKSKVGEKVNLLAKKKYMLTVSGCFARTNIEKDRIEAASEQLKSEVAETGYVWQQFTVTNNLLPNN